jgi:hypothetical protein
MLTREIYDAVNVKAGVASDPPAGLLIHTAGEVDGVFQIVDVWETAAHAERFDSERLNPAINEVVGAVAGAEAPAGAPAPITYQLHHVIRP